MSEVIKNASYAYITIPRDWLNLYHKILYLLADYGEAKLKDCTAECLKNNKVVLDCYAMFNAAIAAKEIHNNPLANALYKYVEATINAMYKGHALPIDVEEPEYVLDLDNNQILINGVPYTIGETSDGNIEITYNNNNLIINSDIVTVTDNSLNISI